MDERQGISNMSTEVRHRLNVILASQLAKRNERFGREITVKSGGSNNVSQDRAVNRNLFRDGDTVEEMRQGSAAQIGHAHTGQARSRILLNRVNGNGMRGTQTAQRFRLGCSPKGDLDHNAPVTQRGLAG